MSQRSHYASAAITLLLAAAPGVAACGGDDTKSTPSAGPGAVTPGSTAKSDPSRRGPTLAELNLAARDALGTCAQRHDELGLIVGFRDGQAVANTGERGGGGGEFDTRVSAPRAIAAILEDGGQYVGLREGEGPDLDIILLLAESAETGGAGSEASSMIEEEAGRNAVVGGVGGSTARGQFQDFLIVSLDEDAPKARKRTQDALNTCLGRAARAVE